MAFTRFSRKLSSACLLVLSVTTLSLDVVAADYTWTGNAGNGLWQDPMNFTVGGGVATQKPGPEDVVTVPNSTKIVLEFAMGEDDVSKARKLSCETFGGVGRIIPGGANTVIEITVPENAKLELACPIVNQLTSGNADVVGTVVKLGAGELDLTASCVVANPSKSNIFDYDVNMDVRAGVLKLPQTATSTVAYYGDLTVAEDAVVFLPHNSGSQKKANFAELYGRGTLTNDYSAKCELCIRSVANFGGRLTGNIYLYTTGSTMLTGTDSTMLASEATAQGNSGAGAGVAGHGAIGIMKFGHKAKSGVKEASSIGYAESLLSRDTAGAFLYLGQGEDTDKNLYLWQQGNDQPTILDGGCFGGLTWNGVIGPYSSGSTFEFKSSRLILTGSNTTACVINGQIVNASKNGVNYPLCVSKEGSGTWRVNYNASSTMHSVWQVRNGTLAFDTIAPSGVNSALGFSDWLYKDKAGAVPTDADKVDHAFLLGDGKTRGTLEYVGSTNCLSTGRLFAVNGTGAIVNNGTGRLNLSGFGVASGAGDSTLVLGGSNAGGNVADGVKDGDTGVMSVVKEGTGTWHLGADCSFTGSLDVRGGAVVVDDVPRYGYYRWIIRATFTTATGNDRYRNVGLRHFGLYDAEGNLRTDVLSDNGDWHQTKQGSSDCYTSYPLTMKRYFGGEAESLDLAEGHFRVSHYDSSDDMMLAWQYTDRSTFTNLFCRSGDWAPYDLWNRNPQSAPHLKETNTWYVLTLRPRPGAPITSWDYVNHYSVIPENVISNCILEASVDGAHWTKLAEVTNDTNPGRGVWQSDKTSYDPNYATHVGMTIPPGPSGTSAFAATSVSVARNATLEAKTATAPTVRKITVGKDGMGTLRGFALASDGVIDIDGAPAKGAFTVPVDFTGVDLPADYSFTVNGAIDRRDVSLSADKKQINVVPRGLILIVR